MRNLIGRYFKNGYAKLKYLLWILYYGDSLKKLSKIRLPNAGLQPYIWINPNKLLFKTQLDSKSVYEGMLFTDGDWDLKRASMLDHESLDPRYITCIELINLGLDVSETTEYKHMVSVLLKQGKSRGFRSQQQILDYLNQIHLMYRGIKSDGRLKSQSELGMAWWGGEINCAVGRDGTLLKTTDGNHRLAAARVLGLNLIPVQISRIHKYQISSIQAIGTDSALEAVNIYFRDIESKYC